MTYYLQFADNPAQTMHIARHPLGNIAGDKIPIQALQVFYCHSDVTTTVKDQSQFSTKQADDALDSVLDF